MGATRVSKDIDHPRRRLIGAAAMTVAAAQFGMCGSAEAQTGATKPNLPAIKPGTNTTFAPLKQIDAGLLNVGYAEAGPADGSVVLLLHGWPYDTTALSMSPLCWVGRLQGYRPLSARLWLDAIFLGRDVPEWPAIGGRGRYRRLDGRAQNREGDTWRF
jgi:hypothetical protein